MQQGGAAVLGGHQKEQLYPFLRGDGVAGFKHLVVVVQRPVLQPALDRPRPQGDDPAVNLLHLGAEGRVGHGERRRLHDDNLGQLFRPLQPLLEQRRRALRLVPAC